MMKKLFAIIATFTLVFAPLSVIGLDDAADARRGGGFSSGMKGFNPSTKQNTNTNMRNNQQQQQNSNVSNKNTKTNNQTAAQSNRGGLMRGMLYGGLAGLLFGSLFAGMGGFGALLGLAVNVLAIMVLVMVIRKIFDFFKSKKSDEDARSWRP